MSDDDGEDACPICIEPAGADETAALPGCGHIFHAKCLAGWEAVQRRDGRPLRCAMCNHVYRPATPATVTRGAGRPHGSALRRAALAAAVVVAFMSMVTILRCVVRW